MTTLDYGAVCQNLPRYDDTLHTQCTRKCGPRVVSTDVVDFHIALAV